jgi:DNA-binding transcriptional regulator YhcF (GntR family)
MSKQNVVQTFLLCPHCNTVHSIFRKTNRQKLIGHYKKFYCYKCKEERNCIELKNNTISTEELEEIIMQMKEEGKY